MKILYSIGMLILFSAPARSQDTSPIYSFKLDTITHTKQIDLSNFSGKKILVVNVGKLYPNFNYSQWEQFRSLQAQYNNLVIIILPGAEVSDNEVTAFFKKNSIPLIVCSKSSENNSSINELYDWLGKKSSNLLIDINSRTPLQKYLINEQGKLIEVIDPSGERIIRSD